MSENLNDYYFDLVCYSKEADSLNKPYLVAALDILGFSRYVLLNQQTNYLFDGVFWVLAAMRSIEEEFSSDETPTYARFFSDCIFLFFPLDGKKTDEHEFDSFLRKIAFLVETALSKGFLIRGGLCVGKCCVKKTIMWGSGIIKSHILEEKVSKTGRIIIEDRDYQQLKKYFTYYSESTKPTAFDRYFKAEDNIYLSFDSTKYILEVLYAEMEVSSALERYRRLLSIVEENILSTSDEENVMKNLSKLSWHIQRYNDFALHFNQPTVILKQ